VLINELGRAAKVEIERSSGPAKWPFAPPFALNFEERGEKISRAKPVFADDTITLQTITRVSLPLSAGLIGFVEASGRTTADKNRLCRPNPWPQTPFDFTRHLLTGMKTEMEWPSAPDVQAWVDGSRLNLVRGLDQGSDTAAVSDLQRRFLTALFPALTKLDEFASHATAAERARMFEPAV
jgi:hypothetical protein